MSSKRPQHSKQRSKIQDGVPLKLPLAHPLAFESVSRFEMHSGSISKMADEHMVCRVSSFENVGEILSLLWGENVKEDIFERWSQGKAFN